MKDIFEYYTLTLKVRSPVFIGSGASVSKKEYLFDPKTNDVSFVDMEKLIDFLVKMGNNDYIKYFEEFMLNDELLYRVLNDKNKAKNGLSSFLDYIGINKEDRQRFVTYTVKNAGTLSGNNTLKEIRLFVRGRDGRVYVPGSSVKGMLRTIILSRLTLKSGIEIPGEDIGNPSWKDYEQKLINTLSLKSDKRGNPDNKNAVNSIMRGLSISDSAPLDNSCLTICQKIDAKKRGLNPINTVSECLAPGTVVSFRVKIDRRYFRPLNNEVDFPEFLAEMIEGYDEEYRRIYLGAPLFSETEYNKAAFNGTFVILGGGSGYFSKNIVYSSVGFKKGLEKVSRYMIKRFRDHNHNSDKDDHKISPHTLKLTKFKNQYHHFGVCGIELKKESYV